MIERFKIFCENHHLYDKLVPEKATEGSSGFDIKSNEQRHIAVGARVLIKTGLYLELRSGFEALVRPRSGLALKCGITVLNTPGTIDADYRGEIGVILINLGSEGHTIKVGDKIAQLIIQQIPEKIVFHRVRLREDLDSTTRGDGGFGSTG